MARPSSYWADAEVGGPLELYSAPSDGSAAPIKLNGPLAAGGRLWTFRVSPDGTRVVYIADQAALPGTRMYSVPTAGGVVVPLGPASDDTPFAITADSTRVVAEVANHLYSIAIAGGSAPIELSSPVMLPEFSAQFELSPDGTRVLFEGTFNGEWSLFTNSVLGGPPLNLPVSEFIVAGHGFSADGEHVVFTTGLPEFHNSRLYSVPADGSSSPCCSMVRWSAAEKSGASRCRRPVGPCCTSPTRR